MSEQLLGFYTACGFGNHYDRNGSRIAHPQIKNAIHSI